MVISFQGETGYRAGYLSTSALCQTRVIVRLDSVPTTLRPVHPGGICGLVGPWLELRSIDFLVSFSLRSVVAKRSMQTSSPAGSAKTCVDHSRVNAGISPDFCPAVTLSLR